MNSRPWFCATIVAVTLATPTVFAGAPGEPIAATTEATPAEATPAEATPAETGRDFTGPEVTAPASTSDALRAFEGGFDAGQALLERGEPLAAARTWVETVALLPEVPEHRDNRAAVFGYIAEAYERALRGPVPRARLVEALAALDRYADTVAATYGADAPLGPQVVAAREAFRARLAAMDRQDPPAAPKPQLGPGPAPAPVVRTEARPWGALAGGSGAAFGVGAAGLAVMAAGAIRGQTLQQRFDDPARGCDRNAPVGECGEIFREGRSMNTQVIAGAVIGAVGLVAGTTLAVLAHRRRTRATPAVGPGFAGVVLQGRF